MSEVDVIEHPRFCDDFSHLVNRHFVATFLLISHVDGIDLLDILDVLLIHHISYRV